MLFTKQFTKDLLWSVVFIFSMYGITHNPVVRPMSQPIPGNWSIQIMQHPLLFGFAGHNYLALRNQDDEIVGELHGLATDSKTGNWKYIGDNPGDILKVWQFDEPRSYLAEKKYPGIILDEGKHDFILDLWNKAVACKDPINEKHISYPPFGFKLNGTTENSNSVAYTLALCTGLDPKHIGLITPGEKNNLLEK